MRAYNVFRSKGRPELVCAIPEDLTVPRFITDAQWEFACKLDDRTDISRNFDRAAAEQGVRYNGFYLYQSITRAPRTDPTRA